MKLDKIAQVASLLREGSRLVLISDFDHTLSHPDGPIGHKIFPLTAHSGNKTLGEQYAEMNQRLISPLAAANSSQDKAKICLDWWNESHQIIANAGFSMNNLPTYFDQSNLTLRKNFAPFVDLVASKNLPFIISSGGITEVIQLALADYKIPRLEVVANKMLTDETGKIIDFEPPVVHSYNKNGHLLKQFLQDPAVVLGDFVVLLIGDTVSDLLMVEGIDPKLVYSIGYCNFEKHRPAFQTSFDTVLDRDAGMEAVTETLARILGLPTVTEYQAVLSIDPKMPPEAKQEIMTKMLEVDSILSLPHIRCRDRAVVGRKLEKIIADGIDQLVVITDFDYTLSRAVDAEGKPCLTTHGVFDACADEVRPGLSKTFKQLRDQYYPIEFDPHMSIEEKTPHMEEWWKRSHDHIISAGFTRADIERFVRKSRVLLREGADKWLNELEMANVPLIVFSAGIGDVIKIKLCQQLGKISDNVHLLANMMLYDENGAACGFSEPLIHTFCKNSTVIDKAASFYPSLAKRSNVLLLGDSLGDVHMDVGVDHRGHVLRIGFLNFHSADLLEKFLHGYDIVIINDQSINIPEMITKMATTATITRRG